MVTLLRTILVEVVTEALTTQYRVTARRARVPQT
jgi:hypothetical protein